jgi:predicted amidophosphoribosyltransferase
MVGFDQIPGCPQPLQETIDRTTLADVEAKMPLCSACGTRFRYFNPLRCPHCASPYLDFERFPQMRPFEYYGCILAGREVQQINPG